MVSTHSDAGSNPAEGANLEIDMYWNLHCTLRVENDNYIFYVNNDDVESGNHNLQHMFDEIAAKLDKELKERETNDEEVA